MGAVVTGLIVGGIVAGGIVWYHIRQENNKNATPPSEKPK